MAFGYIKARHQPALIYSNRSKKHEQLGTAKSWVYELETVKLFFDTSVLVAASVSGHSSNKQALAAIGLLRDNSVQGFMSQHSIAETYAILTSAPFNPRVQPAQALMILEQNLLPLLQPVPLNPKDYRIVLQSVAMANWRSGRIYDGLILHCAQKVNCDRLYTFNLKDFRALAPPEFQAQVVSP